MKHKPLPSRLRLNELFIYDNGKLIRRVTTSNKSLAGSEAGTTNPLGYRQIQIDGAIYYTHRLIWKLLHGEDPIDIDHINGDRLDNRITNLRSVTRGENLKNKALEPKNRSGVSGVYRPKDRNKWRATIGKSHTIGYYDTFEEAVAARKQAEIEHGYHENHGRVV